MAIVEAKGPATAHPRRRRRLLRIVLVLVLATHVLIPLITAFAIAWPNPFRAFRDYGQPGDFGLEARDVETPEGLRAWYFDRRESDAVVLVCHGRSTHKGYLLPLIARLAGRWDVLAIDFRAHGAHDYATTTIGWDEADDVALALDYLEGEGVSRVAIYGVSMGGASVLHELSRRPRPEVRALVLDGTFDTLENTLIINGRRRFLPDYLTRLSFHLAEWVAGYDVDRVRPLDFAARIDAPTLFLQGDEDAMVSPGAAAALASRMAGRAEHRIYPGGHDEPTNRAMQDLVFAFIAGTLPE